MISEAMKSGFLYNMVGGFKKKDKYVHPYLGKIPILTHIFQKELKPPTSECIHSLKY